MKEALHTLCSSGKSISHYGSKRPCYPANGKTTRGWNQHWKRRIRNTNWHRNLFNGTIVHDYGHETFVGSCLNYQKWCFLVPWECCTQSLSPRDWKFSTLEDNQGFNENTGKATFETNGSDHSSMMNLYGEHDSH
jgi:hypothetical protein